MFDPLYLVCCALAWLPAGIKIRAWLRDRGNTDLGLTAGMCAGVAVVFLLSAPSVYTAFDRLTGVANLALAVLYTAVVGFAVGALLLLLRWTGHTERWSRPVLGAAAALWTVALAGFALGRPDAVEHPRDFSTAYADAPGVALFLILYLVLFGAGLAGLGLLCPRYAARLGPSWLGRGLRTIAAGCRLGLVYCASKLIGFGSSWTGRDLPWLSNGVAPLAASAAALLVTAGFALPAVGPRIDAWRRLRRLSPLWRTATAGIPEVVVGPVGRARGWTFTGLEWRANRRMAEIRDVQRAVRRYVEPEVIAAALRHGAAAGMTERRTAALAEAAALRRGLSNRVAGHLPGPAAETVVVAAAADPAAEHDHLALVADFSRMPVVERILASVPPKRE